MISHFRNLIYQSKKTKAHAKTSRKRDKGCTENFPLRRLCVFASLREGFFFFYNDLAKMISLLSMVLLVACGNGIREDEENETAVTPVVEVKIDSVRVGTIPETVGVTGATKVLRQENIGSPIDGKVTSLRVLEGDAVKRGQVIAVVETKESLAAMTGAQMLLGRAQTAEEKTRAESALQLAQKQTTALEIRAPFDGVVVSRALNEGEFVAAGGALATVIDLRSLYFIAKAPARELARLKLGQEATVNFQSWPEKNFRCRVDNLKPQIDPVAQMAEVRLRFLSVYPELRSDMFGNADIVIGQHHDVFLVPDQAVVRDDETGVHTIVEAVGDSLGVIREVEIGIETPTTVAIAGEAIRAGMHIIVEGHYGLPDSTHIHIER